MTNKELEDTLRFYLDHFDDLLAGNLEHLIPIAPPDIHPLLERLAAVKTKTMREIIDDLKLANEQTRRLTEQVEHLLIQTGQRVTNPEVDQ